MKKIKYIIVIIVLMLVCTNNVNALSLDCYNTLREGNSGNQVKNLQKMLNTVSSCELNANGEFDSDTLSCVVDFQEENNLETDGIVGKKTCKKLVSVYNDEVLPMVVVTASKLNVRKKPGTSNKIITTVHLGEKYYIRGVEKVDNTKWYKIKTNVGMGYVSSSYAKKDCILIDISKQRLTYYKNGKNVLYTNVVTGMKGKHDTPVGSYTLKVSNKEKNRTLKGRNDNGTKYSSYVKYWMPFITERGIGLHDASWKSSFGGKVYKTNGSHGCVNMPSAAAKDLYKKIDKDTKVVVID